jgi:hypothetical protein
LNIHTLNYHPNLPWGTPEKFSQISAKDISGPDLASNTKTLAFLRPWLKAKNLSLKDETTNESSWKSSKDISICIPAQDRAITTARNNLLKRLITAARTAPIEAVETAIIAIEKAGKLQPFTPPPTKRAQRLRLEHNGVIPDEIAIQDITSGRTSVSLRYFLHIYTVGDLRCASDADLRKSLSDRTIKNLRNAIDPPSKSEETPDSAST